MSPSFTLLLTRRVAAASLGETLAAAATLPEGCDCIIGTDPGVEIAEEPSRAVPWAAGDSIGAFLNRAIPATRGRTLLLAPEISASIVRHLPQLDEMSGRNAGTAFWLHDGFAADVLDGMERRLGAPPCSAYLLAGGGGLCLRRRAIPSKPAFDEGLEGWAFWVDFALRHVQGGRIGTGFTSAVYHHQVRRAIPAEPGAGWGLSSDAVPRFRALLDAWPLPELQLSRPLVLELEGALADRDPSRSIDLLGRIEAIVRCCRDVVPVRGNYSFLAKTGN